jgi:FtsZ-binding cell division protein ZapB
MPSIQATQLEVHLLQAENANLTIQQHALQAQVHQLQQENADLRGTVREINEGTEVLVMCYCVKDLFHITQPSSINSFPAK